MGSVFLLCLLVCHLVVAAHAQGVMEIYVAVDQSVVDQYKQLGSITTEEATAKAQTDSEFFLTELNKIFANLQSDNIDLQLRVRRLDILDKNVFKECGIRDNRIQADLGIFDFQTYLSDNSIYSSLNYDLAILWTGFEIFGQSDSTAGYAKVNTVCAENGIGIVEFDGTYTTVHLTAHEIGHILGLSHDTSSCSNGHVMEDTQSNTRERYTFSPCSISALQSSLPGRACLQSTNEASTVPNTLATALDLLDADIICQRARNDTKSFMCQSANFYNNQNPQGDVVCERIYCGIPGTNTCFKKHPTDGMVCAVGQRCSQGRCVTPSDLPVPTDVTANCVFGDHHQIQFISGETVNCKDYIESSGRKDRCYTGWLEEKCCGTCLRLKNVDLPGCEYGDTTSQCTDYTRDQVCPDYSETLCCEYCAGWRRKRDVAGQGQVQLEPNGSPTSMSEPDEEGQDPKKTGDVAMA